MVVRCTQGQTRRYAVRTGGEGITLIQMRKFHNMFCDWIKLTMYKGSCSALNVYGPNKRTLLLNKLSQSQ